MAIRKGSIWAGVSFGLALASIAALGVSVVGFLPGLLPGFVTLGIAAIVCAVVALFRMSPTAGACGWAFARLGLLLPPLSFIGGLLFIPQT